MNPRNKIVLSGWSSILVALLLPFASLAVPQRPPQGKDQATAAPADAVRMAGGASGASSLLIRSTNAGGVS